MTVAVCPRCKRVTCICCAGRRFSRARILAAAVTAGLLLAGCGASGPHGTVTGKEHDPAQTHWRTVAKTKRVCTTTSRRTGKTTSRSRSCRTVPDGTRRVADHSPECWELELDTGDEVCVSEDTWRATAIGDQY
ncbi:MAG TPA: hypothetical protein VFH77_17350 [Streptomyces sp.]|nr:hypothetical protein [Streptomyces sp.]